MAPGPKATMLVLSQDAHAASGRVARRHRGGQALATRARVVLACAEAGVTDMGVARAFGLAPHRSDTFFVEEVRDVVGPSMAPPERALALCADAKPRIQAVEGPPPVLPLRPGQPERRTHDHKRNGTLDLFAAPDIKTGRVIGACDQRHRATEFRAFLDQVEAAVPPGSLHMTNG